MSLNPDCATCLDRLKNRLAAIFAGSLATEYEFRNQHKPYDAQFDAESIDREFSYFPITPARRFTIEKAAKVRAGALVRQERNAILALTESLIAADGNLSGPEATKVIVEHLSGNQFYLTV